jgi:hypothetical protein
MQIIILICLIVFAFDCEERLGAKVKGGEVAASLSLPPAQTCASPQLLTDAYGLSELLTGNVFRRMELQSTSLNYA